MENNFYRVNISKWIPVAHSPELSSLYEKMILLKSAAVKHIQNIILFNDEIHDCIDCQCKEKIESLTIELEGIVENYESMCTIRNTCGTLQAIDSFKVEHLFSNIKRLLHVMTKSHYDLIAKIMNGKNDEITKSIFRLVNAYNTVCELESEIMDTTINIFSNDCPSTLDVSNKKMSTTRILQALAKNKAEEYCHSLLDCLLKIYDPHNDEKLNCASADEISENSSVEIYRALTKHMSPPHAPTKIKTTKKMHTAPAVVPDENHNASHNIDIIRELVINQTKEIEKIILISKDIMRPQLFDDKNPKCNSQGQVEMSKREISQISDYYRRISWAAASEILDHVLLWWWNSSSEGIIIWNNHSVGAVHDFQDWLHELIQGDKNKVPTCIKLAILNLCDALGCHVTITCWDEIFRLAYIAAFENTSRPFSTKGTNTGHMFGEVFKLLISLSNKCELGSGEWMIGAPLMELALSEQIIILHRLDHSIHTMRLWATQESKLIAHTWELENYFLIVKDDIDNCINELSNIKLAEHTSGLAVADCATENVQVYVCARMRAKIVSEVQANMLLLKKSSNLSIQILAKICRVMSMANLRMCSSLINYGNSEKNRINGDNMGGPSPYVEMYLRRVLLPVLEVLEEDNYEICNMVLKIMCEAWLDYIYLEQIKFNESDSYKLLEDFAYVSQWISECPIISAKMKDHLLKNEVLRRCEGVGKLLLRQPGEAISMKKRMQIIEQTDGGSPVVSERMPAEMYVPNQEQWLELRAGRRSYGLCLCIERS